jgi:hypothetical protein
MHRRGLALRPFGAAALLFVACFGLLTALLLGNCFSPSYSDCAYRCSLAPPACPDEYECQSDGYCHLHGSTTACVFISTAPQDLATAHDSAPAGD